jgi:anti-sigma regulatory factor (Ser/Thr protein kinase)
VNDKHEAVGAVTESPNVSFALTSLPENVSLVREMLTGVADFMQLDEGMLDDIKTAVSEACNNVVLHAYGGDEGPLRVEVSIHDGALEIVVSDEGTGIRPRPPSDEHMQGIGLSVIQALTDRVQFRGGGIGTEVRMEFQTDRARPVSGMHDLDRAEDAAAIAAVMDGTLASIAIAPDDLAASVLTRVITSLAARARFSIDRLSDAQLVADAIAAHSAVWLTGAHLRVGIKSDPRSLELRVGPLLGGKGQSFVDASAIGGFDPLLKRLADELTVSTAGDSDVLTLRMTDPR